MDEGRKKLRQSRFDFLTNGTLYIIDNFSSGSGRPVFGFQTTTLDDHAHSWKRKKKKRIQLDHPRSDSRNTLPLLRSDFFLCV